METTATAKSTDKRRTARRGYGEGSIYQRDDGRWVAKISAGYDGNGKRLRRVVYGWTKKEVQDELSKLQDQKRTGRLAKSTRQTVAEFLNHWIENVGKLELSPTTYTRFVGIIRNHVNPNIGGINLSKLEAGHVDLLLSGMERKGQSVSERFYAHSVLRQALGVALRRGQVLVNVCSIVSAPRPKYREIMPLTLEQT